MMKLKIYFLFILAGSSLPLAQGATRTIQFAGIASSRFSNAAINNENVKMFCTVVVVNTGGTAQKITGIKFARYDATTGGTSFSSAGTSHLIGTTLSGTDTTGRPQIAPARSCSQAACASSARDLTRSRLTSGRVFARANLSRRQLRVGAGISCRLGSIATVQSPWSWAASCRLLYQSGPPINGGSYDASAVAVNYGSGMSGNGYKAQMNLELLALARKNVTLMERA